MKILCCTDFSARARRAVQLALTLVQRTGGALEILHVLPPRTEDYVALAADAAVFEHQLRSEAQTRLAAECRELASENLQLTSWLAEGDVEATILSRADAIGADLIVMGAHSRSGLARFILGSTAERTVRRSARPVLIVPPDAELRQRPSDGKNALNILVALDGRATSRGTLDFVRWLRQRADCGLTFLRLYWPFEEYARLGLTGARDLSKPDPEITADLTRTLAIEVGALPGNGQMSFAIQSTWGEPASAILDFARSGDFDLLVMGAESRHGLSRIAHVPVANRVARQVSNVPVLFAPSPAEGPGQAELPALSTVLAATDFSPGAGRAVGFAYELLAGRGGVVELCHVHERSLPSPAYAYDSPQGKLSDTERTRLLAALRALVPADAERLGITTHLTVVDGGKAASAILQAAERLAVDSIVVGSHGRGATYRMLIGSVSEEVVRHARRPVLVVPRSKEAS